MSMERPKKTRRRPRRPKKSLRRKRIVLFFLAALAIISVLILGVRAMFNLYDTSSNAQMQSRVDEVQSGPADEFKQFSPDVPLYVLLVGVDDKDPQESNFVALAAINKEKQHVDFIMLPDNTKIEGRKEKGSQELSEIYNEGGLKLTQAVVEDIFHIPVPFYAVFTEDNFKDIINETGGLSIYVEKDMYKEDENGKTDINLLQGYQTLNGDKSLEYVRYIDQDGQLARSQRQERFVKLFYAAMQQEHFGIVNMYRTYRLWKHVLSNVPARDMAKLSYSFKDIPVTSISFYILPGELIESKGKEYWNFDPVEVQKIIGNTNNALASDDEKSKTDGSTQNKTTN